MGSAVAQHFGESTPADPQHPYRGMLVYFGYRLSSVCLVNADTIGGSDELSLGRGSKVKLSKVGTGSSFRDSWRWAHCAFVCQTDEDKHPCDAPTAPSAAGTSKLGTTTVAAAGFSYIGAVSAPETEEGAAKCLALSLRNALTAGVALAPRKM